jgi:hypothetical protein
VVLRDHQQVEHLGLPPGQAGRVLAGGRLWSAGDVTDAEVRNRWRVNFAAGSAPSSSNSRSASRVGCGSPEDDSSTPSS